jgi:hypothetical protein
MPGCRRQTSFLAALAALAALSLAAPAAAAPVRKPARAPGKPAAKPAANPAARPPAARPPAKPAPPALLALEVHPAETALAGPRAERQLVVTGRFSDGAERDMTEHVKFFSTAPATVRVSPSGLVTPAADGDAQVKVVAGRITALARVSVRDAAREELSSFHNAVIPVLTKAGCNMGACHGAQHGKGGLKLSVLGYDPAADFNTIAREGGGRRVTRSEPEESLLLKKATLGMPHGGGMRFKPDSYEYRVLLRWLRDGAPAPAGEEPAVERLEVHPAKRRVALREDEPLESATVAVPQPAGAPRLVALPRGQRLAVTAVFKDGRTEDVTRKAQFNTLNDGVATVDADGRAAVEGRGETAIMVRYRGQATVARITVPFRALLSFPPVARASYVDDLVAAKWREMGLTPSPHASDAEFIRHPPHAGRDPRLRQRVRSRTRWRPSAIRNPQSAIRNRPGRPGR